MNNYQDNQDKGYLPKLPLEYNLTRGLTQKEQEAIIFGRAPKAKKIQHADLEFLAQSS